MPRQILRHALFGGILEGLEHGLGAIAGHLLIVFACGEADTHSDDDQGGER